jgi:hypothetical protein
MNVVCVVRQRRDKGSQRTPKTLLAKVAIGTSAPAGYHSVKWGKYPSRQITI